MSAVAADLEWMPHTLGVRPQAMKLKFISPQTAETVFRPRLLLKDIVSRIQGRLDATTRSPLLYRAFIGETTRIIFAPIYIRNSTAFDAVLCKPIAPLTESSFRELQPFVQKEDLHITFIPCLCPSCGWDLEGDKETLVLLCRNCDSAWLSTAPGLEKIEFALLPGEGSDAYYLPFWKIQAQIKGMQLKTRADLMRITNAAQTIKQEWEEMEVYFWSPAFKVSPGSFLRLSQRMTMAQPVEAEKQDLPHAPFYPVTLPVQESAESLKVVLAESALRRKEFFPRLPEISIRVESFKLVYVPFQASASEFIHPQMSLSINKNTLRFGASL